MSLLQLWIFNIFKFKKTENIIIFRHLKKSRDQVYWEKWYTDIHQCEDKNLSYMKNFCPIDLVSKVRNNPGLNVNFLTCSKLVFGLSFRVLKHSVDEFYITRWGIFLSKRWSQNFNATTITSKDINVLMVYLESSALTSWRFAVYYSQQIGFRSASYHRVGIYLRTIECFFLLYRTF